MTLDEMFIKSKEKGREAILKALDSALCGLPREVHFELRKTGIVDSLYLVGKRNGSGERIEYLVGTLNLDTREYQLVEEVTSSVPFGYIAAKDVLPNLGFTRKE